MGKFIDNTSAKHPARRKKLQTCTMELVIDADDKAQWHAAVDDWPNTYEMRITHVDGWVAHAEIDYTAHGANRTDVSRLVFATTLQAIMGPTKTVQL